MFKEISAKVLWEILGVGEVENAKSRFDGLLKEAALHTAFKST